MNIAANVFTVLRAGHVARPVSIEYLAAATAAGQSGWFLTMGDATRHGIEIPDAPAFVAIARQNIEHHQFPVMPGAFNAIEWATRGQRRTDARAAARLVQTRPLDTLTAFGKAVDADIRRNRGGVRGLVKACGGDETFALAMAGRIVAVGTVIEWINENVVIRARWNKARTEVKKAGYRLTF